MNSTELYFPMGSCISKLSGRRALLNVSWMKV